MAFLRDVPEVRSKPMRDIIHEHLRKAIVLGELKPDTMFTDAEIAEEFGVSRTPVREALQKLESNGYIERVPMKGNRVCGISPNEMAHSFSIRKAVECLAVRYAAVRITEQELAAMGKIVDRMDDARANLDGDALLDELFPLVKEFNQLTFKACKSSRLLESVIEQREVFDRYLVMRLVLPNRVDKSIDRRRALYEAFLDRNPEKAAEIWEEHLEESFYIWREKSGYAAELKDFIFF